MTTLPHHLAELADVAARASRGPWVVRLVPWKHVDGSEQVGRLIDQGWDHPQLKGPMPIVGMSIRMTEDESARKGVWLGENDARFIAAFNPRTAGVLVRVAMAADRMLALAADEKDLVKALAELKSLGGEGEG